jgi:hypothetical protein
MPFRFDKFTIKAQEAVQAAVELAGNRGNPQVTPVHVLQASRRRFPTCRRCREAPSRSRIRS